MTQFFFLQHYNLLSQPIMKPCIVCNKLTNSCCELCKTAFYCTREHQAQDWQRHKYICQGRQQLPQSQDSYISSSAQRSKTSSNNPRSGKLKPPIAQSAKRPMAELPRVSKHTVTQPSSIYISEPETSTRMIVMDTTVPTVEELLAKTDHFIELNERRKGERREMVLEYVKVREEAMLVRGQNIVKLSFEIWQDFDKEIAPILFREYRIRTSKFMQQMEYLLDITFLCKLHLKMANREKLKQILYQLELPEFPQRVDVIADDISHKNLEPYKNYKQETESYRKVLSLLAAVSNAGGFTNFTQKLYARYILLVQDSSGTNEQFLSYYMVGVWYTQVEQFNKAIACFTHCLSLMQPILAITPPPSPLTPTPSQMLLSNCYYNIALSQRMLNKIEQSCESMLNCLAIRREQTVKNQIQVSDCLEFIGRQFMEMEKYQECIDFLNQCHKIRMELLKPDDHKLQRVQELVKILYKLVKEKKDSKEQAGWNYKEADRLDKIENRLVELIRREYPEIETYLDKIKKNQKTKLNIKLDPQWFSDMKPEQLQSFAQVINNCQELQPQMAVASFFQSKFYTNLPQDRKTRLKQLNPNLTEP